MALLRSPNNSTFSAPDLTEFQREDKLTHLGRRKRNQEDRDNETLATLSSFMVAMQSSMDELKASTASSNEELKRLTSATSEMKSVMEGLRAECTGVKEKVEAVAQEVLEVKEAIDFTATEISMLKEKDNVLHTEIHKLRHELLEVKVNMNNSEQRERFNNLEIRGLPESKSEELSATLALIAEHAGVALTPQDVVHITRVQPRQSINGRPRVVVAKLKLRILKDNIISGIRKARGLTTKDLGIHGKPVPVYVSDHLTPTNKALLRRCKELAAAREYQYVWVKNCRIYVRKNAASQCFMVNSEIDFQKIT